MKNSKFAETLRVLAGAGALLCAVALIGGFLGCTDGSSTPDGGGTAQAAFTALTADGSATAITTKLTLTFDKDIVGLSAGDITLTANNTGAAKGALSRTGVGVYELALNGITGSGQVTVGVAKSGYAIIPASLNVTVYCTANQDTSITFSGLPQDETIELGAAQALSKSSTNNTLTITPLSGFDAYRWYLDGKILNGETGGGITLNAVDCRTGTHYLTVKVSKGGTSYSKTVTFSVTL